LSQIAGRPRRTPSPVARGPVLRMSEENETTMFVSLICKRPRHLFEVVARVRDPYADGKNAERTLWVRKADGRRS
jgi:hypothetical protein